MGPQKRFEIAAYELVPGDSIHIADHQFGHNQRGELDVWIESGDKGKRFLSQLKVEGEPYAVRRQAYTKECFILRERKTGRYWFLDRNVCGFWLQDESFFGARTFSGADAIMIQNWIRKGLPCD